MHLCYPVYNNSYSCDLRLQIYSTSLRVGLSLQITICVPLVSNRMENPLQLARTVQCTYSTVIYTCSFTHHTQKTCRVHMFQVEKKFTHPLCEKASSWVVIRLLFFFG